MKFFAKKIINRFAQHKKRRFEWNIVTPVSLNEIPYLYGENLAVRIPSDILYHKFGKPFSAHYLTKAANTYLDTGDINRVKEYIEKHHTHFCPKNMWEVFFNGFKESDLHFFGECKELEKMPPDPSINKFRLFTDFDPKKLSFSRHYATSFGPGTVSFLKESPKELR